MIFLQENIFMDHFTKVMNFRIVREINKSELNALYYVFRYFSFIFSHFLFSFHLYLHNTTCMHGATTNLVNSCIMILKYLLKMVILFLIFKKKWSWFSWFFLEKRSWFPDRIGSFWTGNPVDNFEVKWHNNMISGDLLQYLLGNLCLSGVSGARWRWT